MYLMGISEAAREIIEARWIPLTTLAIRLHNALFAAGRCGLIYRAPLQCRALEALWKAKVKNHVSKIQEDFMDR